MPGYFARSFLVANERSNTEVLCTFDDHLYNSYVIARDRRNMHIIVWMEKDMDNAERSGEFFMESPPEKKHPKLASTELEKAQFTAIRTSLRHSICGIATLKTRKAIKSNQDHH